MFNMEGMGENVGTLEKYLDPGLMSYAYNMAGGWNRTYGEDCLALNVWTKPGAQKKAVMVWVYGGGMSRQY